MSMYTPKQVASFIHDGLIGVIETGLAAQMRSVAEPNDLDEMIAQSFAELAVAIGAMRDVYVIHNGLPKPANVEELTDAVSCAMARELEAKEARKVVVAADGTEVEALSETDIHALFDKAYRS